MIQKQKERMVVYKPLYNREDNRQLWVRPEKKCF